MAPISVTLCDLKGGFSCLKPFKPHTSGNTASINYDMLTRRSENVRNLNYRIENGGLLKVIGNPVP